MTTTTTAPPSTVGYPYIRLWDRMLGSSSAYTLDVIARAHQTRAPWNAIHRKDDGSWATTDDVSNLTALDKLAIPESMQDRNEVLGWVRGAELEQESLRHRANKLRALGGKLQDDELFKLANAIEKEAATRELIVNRLSTTLERLPKHVREDAEPLALRLLER